jgi:hypothetical protein
MVIPTLEEVATKELLTAAGMVLPTIGFCIWQQRPFFLWILHALMIQYLCLSWIDYPYARCGIGLLITLVLILVTEKRNVTSL